MENKHNVPISKDNAEDMPKLDIQYDDLLLVSSGITEEGNPVSIATAVLDKINLAGEQVADMQMIMQDAVIYLYHSGGCTVMQADFPQKAAFEFSRVIEMLSVYSQNSSNPEYVKSHGLGLVVVPMLLYGQISIVFQDIVYFTGFDLPDMGKRLVICFNDLATEVLHAGGDIDYDAIVQTVRADIQREHDRVEEEIRQVQAELEQIQSDNPYQQMISDRYRHDRSGIKEVESGNEEPKNTWIRTSKD